MGRSNSPYTNRTLLAGAPLREKIYAGANNFLISRDYFVTNKPDPTQMKINFDDGAGYRTVNFGDVVSVNYVNGQSKTVKIKISQNNISYVANAKSATEYCQCGYPDVDDVLTITGTIPFYNPSSYPIYPGDGQWWNPNANGTTYADVYVKYGSGHTKGNLVKPLIFVEGIDFGYDANFTGNPNCPQRR